VPVAVESNRTFRDADVRDGAQYFYSIVACYSGPRGGAVLRSAPHVERGASRVDARPVTTLTVAATPGEALSVRLSWRQRPGTEVVLRRGSRPCPWDYGAVVPAAELRSWGAELDGRLSLRGEAATLVAALPPGRSYCVPFSIGTDGAVRGQDAVVDLTDPVQRVEARRFGADVLVTWHWPDHVPAADVRWNGGHRRIGHRQYRDEGGCRLSGLGSVRRIEVSAITFTDEGDETRSPAVATEVAERRPELTYQLRRRGNRLLGGVQCTVTVSSAVPVSGATLVLVGAAGHAMPLSPTAGVELQRQVVTVVPHVPLELPEVAVPSHLRKPYWLRCFLADEPAPALLVDPPVSQLKVS
jgi:hypothetical protein